MLRSLMLEDVERERGDKVEKEMKANLQKYVNAYNESQRLLKAMQKYKETWKNKLADIKPKDDEIPNKRKYLQESLDDAILSKKELEGEVSELTDELVSTSFVYFHGENNRFLLLSHVGSKQIRLP